MIKKPKLIGLGYSLTAIVSAIAILALIPITAEAIANTPIPSSVIKVPDAPIEGVIVAESNGNMLGSVRISRQNSSLHVQISKEIAFSVRHEISNLDGRLPACFYGTFIYGKVTRKFTGQAPITDEELISARLMPQAVRGCKAVGPEGAQRSIWASNATYFKKVVSPNAVPVGWQLLINNAYVSKFENTDQDGNSLLTIVQRNSGEAFQSGTYAEMGDGGQGTNDFRGSNVPKKCDSGEFIVNPVQNRKSKTWRYYLIEWTADSIHTCP